MEQSEQNIQPDGFDAKRVSNLLESAALAEQDGNARLAIHLYCAAFEASQESGESADERALDGLRQAWALACKEGDRPTAETIFNDLAPYNSIEQTRDALNELQEMALGQLGIDKDEMEDLAVTLANEIADAGIDVEALHKRFDNLQDPSLNLVDLGSLPSLLSGNLGKPEHSPEPRKRHDDHPDFMNERNDSLAFHQEPRYSNLPGFEQAMEQMQVFGVVDPGNAELMSFIRQAESFHGISGPVLTQNFLFVGSSREDTGVFALATANEIGWPVVSMIIEANDMGDATVRVAAPTRRSYFGPPRINELPNPCILVIQNIDILQQLFWGEEQAMRRGFGPFGDRSGEGFGRPGGMPGHQHMHGGGMPGMNHPFAHRTFQGEVLGYLNALFARGGIFIIATSAKSPKEELLVLSEHLLDHLDWPVEIRIDNPDLSERQDVLEVFSDDHPSFRDLDLQSLARLSEGMSRFEIAMSCRQAVEQAYSVSLRSQRHLMVTLGDVLSEFIKYLPQGSDGHRLAEDYLVALFTADLETEMLHTDIDSHQITLDFEDDE